LFLAAQEGNYYGQIQCGGRLISSTKLQAWKPAPPGSSSSLYYMDDGSQLDGNGNHKTLSERSIFPQDWSLKEIKCFSFSLNLFKQILMMI
jgi:hypothetical protein